MNYCEFTEKLQHEVQSILGEDYKVIISKVYKPNDVILDALNITDSESKFSPNIYLRPVFDFYENNRYSSGIPEIARMVIDTNKDLIGNYPDITPGIDFINRMDDFEYIRNKIGIKLVNQKLSEEMLGRMAHIPFLDLAATFCITAMKIGDTSGIIRITNEMAENWEISSDELFDIAMENMKKDAEFKMKAMSEAMKEITDRATQADIEYSEDIFDLGKDENGVELMYTIYDDSLTNGSAAILMNDLLGSYADELDSDLLILPSSVNELICMKDDAFDDYERVKNVVESANNAVVYPDEVLSYNIYRYSRQDNEVSIIA